MTVRGREDEVKWMKANGRGNIVERGRRGVYYLPILSADITPLNVEILFLINAACNGPSAQEWSVTFITNS
jgi:hypothetical protein